MLQHLLRTVPLLFSLAAAVPLAAQCSDLWSPPSSFPGVYAGEVLASHRWDPDGAGPLPARLVFGGTFASAGTSYDDNLAVHDEASGAWSGFGADPDGAVRAIASNAAGELIVAGDFTTIGGVAANRIARWTGTAWSPIGAGTNDSVHALLLLQNGDLLLGGDFTIAGGAAALRLARLSPAGVFSAGMNVAGVGFNNTVRALLQTPTGDVYVGGDFTALQSGGVGISRIARWNGTAWSGLLSGLQPGTNGPVHALARLPNGEIVLGGDFTAAGSTSPNNVVRWSGGGGWSTLGNGLTTVLGQGGRCDTLVVLGNGDLIAGGSFAFSGGTAMSNVARWTGNWSPLTTGCDGPVATLLALPNGDLVAGGDFDHCGATEALGLARFQQGVWSALAPNRGAEGQVGAMATMPNGDLVIAGDFTVVDGVPCQDLARWNGSVWQPIGSSAAPRILAVAALPTGDLVAGGIDGRVRRWDGQAWIDMGLPMNAPIEALAVLPDGTVVAGGPFSLCGGVPCHRVVRWTGSGWQSLGSGLGGFVSCLTVLADGRLAAGGNFSLPGGLDDVAVWNGAVWSGLGDFVSTGGVYDLLELPNGDLVVGGGFTSVNGMPMANVARWSAGSWQPFGLGVVGTVLSLWATASGDVLAAGSLTSAGGMPVAGIARWSGSSWQSVAGGVAGGAVFAMREHGNRVYVGGSFFRAGPALGRALVPLANTCEATSMPFGSGCAGSNGLDTLQQLTPPWIGGVFRARGSGLPSFGLMVGVTGLLPFALPLDAVFAEALPGCTLHCTPDILGTYALTGSTIDIAFALPVDLSLIGVVFWQQVVSIGLDVQLQATEMTASNALQITIGTL